MTLDEIEKYKALVERLKIPTPERLEPPPPKAEFIVVDMPGTLPPPPRPKREPYKCRKCGQVSHTGKCKPEHRRAHLGLPAPATIHQLPSVKEAEIDKRISEEVAEVRTVFCPPGKITLDGLAAKPNAAKPVAWQGTEADPELAAIDAVLHALDGLGIKKARRVLRYVMSRKSGGAK